MMDLSSFLELFESLPRLHPLDDLWKGKVYDKRWKGKVYDKCWKDGLWKDELWENEYLNNLCPVDEIWKSFASDLRDKMLVSNYSLFQRAYNPEEVNRFVENWLCRFLKQNFTCWAKARKAGTSAANGNYPLWMSRLKVYAEADAKNIPSAPLMLRDDSLWSPEVRLRQLIRAGEKCLKLLEDMLLKLMVTEDAADDEEEEEEEVRWKKRNESESSLVYAVAVSAVAELALLYLYLVGLIDRGGTKTYSPGSRLFSSTFVSIVLVLAFYVWFKSRHPPCRQGYRRRGQRKPEARYKPPGASGNFSLGICADDEEAGIKQEIAAFYYGRHSRWLVVKDHEDRFEIPLTPSAPAHFHPQEKRRWVKTRVREVYEDFKSFRAGLSNPPVQQVEHDPSVAFDLGFRVEHMDQYTSDNPEAMIYVPHCSAAETQVVHDNHVAEAVMMQDNLGDGGFGNEPAASWVSAENNAVHGFHSEDGVGGVANGGAANDIPQSNSCEVPSALSPSRESPTNFEFPQQQSAPMAGLSYVVMPSVVHLCEPQNSTLELQLALKLVSRLEQQIEEKDRLIAEKDRQNEEQARMIVELKCEVERWTSILQH